MGFRSNDGCITNSLFELRVAVDVQPSNKLLPAESQNERLTIAHFIELLSVIINTEGGIEATWLSNHGEQIQSLMGPLHQIQTKEDVFESVAPPPLRQSYGVDLLPELSSTLTTSIHITCKLAKFYFGAHSTFDPNRL